MTKVELLSPAGDLERLKITLLYGADAVYIGGQSYSLRANATNFSLEEIKEGCTFAHNLNKKVYLTLNIVFHNEDMQDVESYIDKVVACGIDAFIVSDPFIISYIKNKHKNVEVHLSTQNSTSNYKAVEYFKNEGVDRVVLAREVGKTGMQEIIEKTVKYVEQTSKDLSCKEKKNKALKKSLEWMKEKKINISDTELEILIESAVNCL